MDVMQKIGVIWRHVMMGAIRRVAARVSLKIGSRRHERQATFPTKSATCASPLRQSLTVYIRLKHVTCLRGLMQSCIANYT